MFKKLVFVIFSSIPITSNAVSLEAGIMGGTVQFERPIDFQGTVVEKSRGMIYWVEPLKDDNVGIQDLKKYVELTRTNNYMAAPFLIQFRMAGVNKDTQSGLDLTNDNFYKEVDKSIDSELSGKKFYFRCYGYYSYTIVPYCNLINESGESPASNLIKKGYIVPDSDLGQVDEDTEDQFNKSLEDARNSQSGMWKPFHGMFRGLQ